MMLVKQNSLMISLKIKSNLLLFFYVCDILFLVMYMKKRNIIITVVIVLLFIVLIILSTKVGGSNSKRSNFSSSEFENITAAGLAELKTSVDSISKSIFFICDNEDEKCYEELTDLNALAGRYKLSIEYINVKELVASEVEDLKTYLPIFDNELYPKLILVNDDIAYSEGFQSKSELIKVFKENNFI